MNLSAMDLVIMPSVKAGVGQTILNYVAFAQGQKTRVCLRGNDVYGLKFWDPTKHHVVDLSECNFRSLPILSELLHGLPNMERLALLLTLCSPNGPHGPDFLYSTKNLADL